MKLLSQKHLHRAIVQKGLLLKTFRLVLIVSSLAFESFGQTNEVGIKSGVLLSGKIPFYEGVLDIGSSPSFGIDYTLKLTQFSSLNIEYTWASKANAYFREYGYSNVNSFTSRLQTHYFQVNRIREYPLPTAVVPYTITGVGLAYFNLRDRGDKTLLGFNLGGGSKFKLSPQLDLKLQGRFLLPLLFEGGGFFFDIFNPGNSGLSLYSTIPLLQGEFSLGLSHSF